MADGDPTTPGEASLFDFEKGGTSGRRTLAEGASTASVLLDRLHASPTARAALLASSPSAEPPTEAAALLLKFCLHGVLNISWYEKEIQRLKRRWLALQVGLWVALVAVFVGLIGITMKGGMLSTDPNAWVTLLSAFGTFAFGIFQTVQTSTNQKGKLTAFRLASSALKTELYALEDTWVDQLSARVAEPEPQFKARLEAELLPKLRVDLDARVRTARKVLREEQGTSFDAEAAADAFAKALPTRLGEAGAVIKAVPAVSDPNRDERERLDKAVVDAREAVASAEAQLAAAEAGLKVATEGGASAATISTQTAAVEQRRIDLAAKRELLRRAELAPRP